MNYWVGLVAAALISLAVRFALPVAVFAWLLDELDIPWEFALGASLVGWVGWTVLQRLSFWLAFRLYRRRARVRFLLALFRVEKDAAA